MYNNGQPQNCPQGLVPYKYLNGSLWNGQTNDYPIIPGAGNTLATNPSLYIMKNDPVTYIAGQGVTGLAWPNINDSTVNTQISYAANTVRISSANPAVPITTPLLGSFQGCTYIDAVTNELKFSPFWSSSFNYNPNTVPMAHIADDPNILYNIQVSSSVRGAGVNGATFTAQTTATTALGLQQSMLFTNIGLGLGIGYSDTPSYGVLGYPTTTILLNPTRYDNDKIPEGEAVNFSINANTSTSGVYADLGTWVNNLTPITGGVVQIIDLTPIVGNISDPVYFYSRAFYPTNATGIGADGNNLIGTNYTTPYSGLFNNALVRIVNHVYA
jgi:hypothetical protein